jgi:large-conductance mechanosensitive channel
MPGGDLQKAVVSLPIGNGMNFAVGDFVSVIVDFLIVSVVVFFIAEYASKAMEKPEEGMKEGVKEGTRSEDMFKGTPWITERTKA